MSVDPTSPAQPLRPVQRTAAYGVITDPSGGVLLLRVPGGLDPQGRWSLPGGLVRHGEQPRERVRAGLLEQTGLRAASITPRNAGADVVELPEHGVSVHTLRLLFDVTLHGRPIGIGGPDRDAEQAHQLVLDRTDQLPGEDPAVTPAQIPSVAEGEVGADAEDGAGERPVAQFVGRFMSAAELAGLPLSPFLTEALSVPGSAGAAPDRTAPVSSGGVDLLDPPLDPVLLMPAAPQAPAGPEEVPVFVQRPAAYAVLVDESAAAGPRMLLSRLSGSRDTWTLPGGGIDHGEHPLQALRREIHEEAGLPYADGELIDISSRHFVGRAPLGRLEDFHALRLIYAGSVPVDQEPQVIEVDGSTDLAAWVPIADLGRIGAVPTVRDALAAWQAHRDGRSGGPAMDDLHSSDDEPSTGTGG